MLDPLNKLETRLQTICDSWAFGEFRRQLGGGFRSRVDTLVEVARSEGFDTEARRLALESLSDIRETCRRRSNLADFARVLAQKKFDILRAEVRAARCAGENGEVTPEDILRALAERERCQECGRRGALRRCVCRCRRQLCSRCAEIDFMTSFILAQLAR